MSMFGSIRPAASSSSAGYLPTVSSETVDVRAVVREVEAGLPNEQERLTKAIVNLDYFNGDSEKHIDYRDAESVYDHHRRPKRTTKLAARVIEVLTTHLYNPGPSRRLEGSPTADAWLQEVYTSNHVDALFQEADQLSLLNDVAAFQVAALGDPSEAEDVDTDALEEYTPPAPIKIHLLGSEEFAVWANPADPTKPWAVCTISRFNERTRYQLWTVEKYWTFYTEQLKPGQTSGGRVSKLEERESGDNPYGILPFAFVHAHLPTRQFWTHGPGTALRKANAYLDNRLSELADSIRFYTRPVGLAYDVRPDWRPLFKPGGFTHVPADPNNKVSGRQPKLEHLQATLDIAGEWSDMGSYVDRVLEDHGVPRSSIRLEQSSAVSGEAIYAEQYPLLAATKKRQRPFAFYETNLARVVLWVGGTYYQRPDLVAAALKPELHLVWPEFRVSIPGETRDRMDDWEMSTGSKSPVHVVMERYGMTREQAVARLEEVAKDNAMLDALGPAPEPVASPGEPTTPATTTKLADAAETPEDAPATDETGPETDDEDLDE